MKIGAQEDEIVAQRETLKDGTVKIWDERGSFTFLRPRPGLVLMLASGKDDGQFGHLPQDELSLEVARYAPVELFMDTGDVMGADLKVQEAWAEWFARNRSGLKSVSILVRSKYMHVTIEMARFFSRTGDLIRVYLDPALFEEALQRAAPGTKLPSMQP